MASASHLLKWLSRLPLLCLLLFILPAAAKLSAKDYRGAEYRTIETFTYGRFEVNFKSSIGPGQTSTFFTYHELGDSGEAVWNEIDIEILGRYDNDVQFNPITRGRINHEYHKYVSFDPSADYHTYVFEWTPDYVAWFIDGEEAHRQTGEHIEGLNLPQKIMMNIWPPAYRDWVGVLDEGQLPFFAYYDWVSYAAYTPGEGNTGTDNNFTVLWRDDFDSWDTERWQKATHTWIGNNSEFIPENIVFRDGKMVLCLTDPINTGYTDKQAPKVLEASWNRGVVKLLFSEQVEKESAENPDNYIFRGGADLVSLALQPDDRTLLMDLENFDPAADNQILAANVKDLSETPNAVTSRFVKIMSAPDWVYPLKINIGGEAWGDFLPGMEWGPVSEYGALGGIDGSHSNAVENTDEDPIFQSFRYSMVGYRIRVPDGEYSLKLHMNEHYWNDAGRRVMDISVNGDLMFENVDMVEEGGKFTALTLETGAFTVENGLLDLHFAAKADVPSLSALELQQLSVTSVGRRTPLSPKSFVLQDLYPNPFNSTVQIQFSLLEQRNLNIRVLDLNGRVLMTAATGELSAGTHRMPLTLQSASGVYFLHISDSHGRHPQQEVKKLLLIK